MTSEDKALTIWNGTDLVIGKPLGQFIGRDGRLFGRGRFGLFDEARHFFECVHARAEVRRFEHAQDDLQAQVVHFVGLVGPEALA